MGRREPFRYALGLVETTGNVGTIEALDAMVKAADVTLLRRERIGGGYQTIAVSGTVGAVKAAVEAGVKAAAAVGELAGSHIIAKPHDELGTLLPGVRGRANHG